MAKYFCAVNKNNYETQKLVDSKYKLAGIDSEFNVTYVNDSLYMVELEGRFVECLFVKNEAEHNIYLIEGNYYKVKVKTELEQIAEKFLSNNSSDTIKSVQAPMPGLLTKIFVNVGDKISIGDALFELEAMKMKNVVKSDVEGQVSEISSAESSSVEKGAVIITIGS